MEASALKYKAVPKLGVSPTYSEAPNSGKSLAPAPTLRALGLGTHHWPPRGAETAGGPSPHPGGSLGEEGRSEDSLQDTTLTPPIPSCPPLPHPPQFLLKREVTTAPAPDATICWRGLMPPGSCSAISQLQFWKAKVSQTEHLPTKPDSGGGERKQGRGTWGHYPDPHPIHPLRVSFSQQPIKAITANSTLPSGNLRLREVK